MALETTIIQEKLTQKFGEKVLDFCMSKDIFSFEVVPSKLHELIQTLRDDEELNFNFLTDLCGIHFPENDENHQFAVVYHLHNWIENTRIRVKTYLTADQK